MVGEAVAPPARPRALLFDLGNVVVDVDVGRSLQAWAAHSRLPAAALQARFAVDAAYCRHETGALDAAGWFEYLRGHLELEGDDARIRDGWNALLLAEIAETTTLIDRVRTAVPCHALSNTNVTHVAAIEERFPGLLPRFARVFVSHEIGHRKPAPEAFAHVLQSLDLPAHEVLFFDDLPENCEAAQALGLQAVLVRQPADVREALEARGLL
ncbi:MULTISPECIES: HAD-IA family hydrolase [Ramlibacter]|uniref:HAD-IA family hydrolase n=1 Tax=Ramlibacter TaxID=174951 RepID=UPI0012FAE230|nr:HAD family phosphatase [Ramlibacter sp. CGMCC 1.13660]